MGKLKIAIRCEDLTASRAFYESVLGLTVVDSWSEAHGDGCIFSVGSGLVEFNEAPGSHDAGPVKRFDIQFEVADLEAWAARIGQGWEYQGPRTQPWGERTLRLRDPDGVLVTVYERMD